ncbi:unnamed protein product [Taenia asiatica]|uniref:Hydrocephalus-inducing protein homolog n=1 Tax=Taenia asiatica TaxID=60517 RepID=A0A0R3VSW5_TAEAS|nr:unnamed protein product [Taenia asiatica]
MGLCLVNSTISKLLPFNLASKKSALISLRPDLNCVFDVLPRECEIFQGITTEALINFSPIVSGEFQTTLQVESGNRHVGEIVCYGKLGKHGTTLIVRAAQLQCKEVFEVLKLHASAAVAPPEITLSPKAITLSDPVVLAEPAKIKVKMSNPSVTCPVSFYWTLPRSEAEDSNVSFCPKSGELVALETRTVNISITPKGLGHWQYLLSCNLNESSETPVLLQISCEVVSPTIELETDLLDFGVVCPNQTLAKNTYLRNSSSMSLMWSAVCPQESNSSFTIRPSGGTIRPKHEQTILVEFHPQSVDRFQEEVEFKVEGAPPPPRTLSLIGQAQIANVTMEPQEIRIDELCVTIPQNFTIKLKNLSSVPAKFRWLTAECTELRSVRVSLSPTQGHIRSLQCVKVVVTLTATAMVSEIGARIRIRNITLL